MPFGAEVIDGATTFRLWAPAARDVALVLGVDGDTRDVPLERDGDGRFSVTVADVGAGARYRYRIDGGIVVPDPASRSNPDGVHAASAVVDPSRYAWGTTGWRGRPWTEAVIYELHVGAFTPAGTFEAAIGMLDRLVDVGITAVELMPVAAFPGARNWGYDGVLPFAPAAAYGEPDDLKRLVDAAHAKGLMMLVDVVYNHFGPEGNYLHAYAPQFFSPRHTTPWGAAINFDAEGSAVVRDFFVHNALYWLDEYQFDGLRLDAVHAIADQSRPDFVAELATRVGETFGAERHVHIVVENDGNEAHRLHRDAAGRPYQATAQWNDDLHHALHVLATGERDGYYADYALQPVAGLGRALAEGFIYQGQASTYRAGETRGEPSTALSPTAHVAFAQNHDQIGNRALGERLAALTPPDRLRALTACVLLSPQVPLLFMGEEFGASSPFLFFCDFGPELASAVTRGRREEFARFERFRQPSAQQQIPDPNAPATFDASKLDWREWAAPAGVATRAFYRTCLAARRASIVPRLAHVRSGTFAVDANVLRVEWPFDDGGGLFLLANLSDDARDVTLPAGTRVYASEGMPAAGSTGRAPAFGVSVIVAAA